MTRASGLQLEAYARAALDLLEEQGHDDAMVRFVVILALVAGALYALDRLGLYAERRGWVYYRKKRGSVPLATAVLETQALFDPSKRYVLEATRTDADESESGGPPQPPVPS